MMLNNLLSSSSSSTERRERRRFEIFCILFIFMFVFNLFGISLWPLLRSSDSIVRETIESTKKEAAPQDAPPAKTLTFKVSSQGDVTIDGKKVSEERISQVFNSKGGLSVELELANRKIVQIFRQCYLKGLAPSVKLAAQN